MASSAPSSSPLSDPHRLTPVAIALLVIPPLMWAGNAVVGRMMQGTIPAFTFNFLRWVLAFLMLLPVAGWALRPRHGLWRNWKRFAALGLLGVGTYNSLQYLALKTSTPINVTLVASSMPVWMLLIGRIFYGVPVARKAAIGAALSLTGVAFVLSRGSLQQLMAVQFVPGDFWMLMAAASWSGYSWLLARPPAGSEPPIIRNNWAGYLMAQMALGLMWSGAMSGIEWAVLSGGASSDGGSPPMMMIHWGWPLVIALLYVAIGPSLIAYRCWGAGVARVGPAIAGFFTNLTPLFAAVMSATLLGELPHWYHGAGFVCIVAGIWVSSRR